MNQHHKYTQSGFALLVTLLVIGVVLAIGLSILELSSKQARLSYTSVESEKSFQAANAGAECGRYWRRREALDFESGIAVPAECFGDSVTFSYNAADSLFPKVSGSGDVHRYEAEFTWASGDRCSQIDMLVIIVPISVVGGLTIGDDSTASSRVDSVYSGYAGGTGDPGENFVCEQGGRCTFMQVRGYNAACSAVTSLNTIQREVLLQF